MAPLYRRTRRRSCKAHVRTSVGFLGATPMSASTIPHDYVGDKPSPQPIARARPSLVYRTLKAIASLRITVVLFSLSMALVFFGTLGMTLDSIDETVHKYFRCWLAWIDLRGLATFGKKFFH